MVNNFGGELAALGAAFLWASASVLYGRIGRYLSPLHMNLLKNFIALTLLLMILLPGGNLLTRIDSFASLLLLLSGAIGIGMGDTLYFGALKHIGTFIALWLQQISLKYTAAGVAQTLFATSPLFVLPVVAVMGEKVSLRAVLGALLAIAGVGMLFGFQSA